jgi:hypothetical protein
MNKTTLELLLKAQDKGAGAALDNLEGSMSEVEQSTSAMEGAVNLAGTALKGFATVETAKAVWELGKFGAESKRTEDAFVNISGGATAAAANLQAMRQATRGAMSETEAMANASQLLQMGLASNAEELGTLTEMATRLGGAMGMDASQAMDDFAALLANKSLPRLDQFGMSSGAVRERFNELKETMGDDEAFKLAVMEQGEEAMARLGEAAEDDQLAFERLSASIRDFKTLIAQELAPATSEAAGGMSEALGTMTDYLKKVQDAGYNISDFADTQKAAMIISGSFTGKLEEQARAHDRVIAASELSAGQMADYAAMNRAMGQEAAAAGEALLSESQIIDLASTSAAEGRKAVNAYTARLTAQAEAHGKTAESALEEAKAQREAKQARLESAQATATLASNLMDATDKQIASALIGMLDPKKMGADAFGKAVSEIGTAYGVMDEKSIALAENLPDLASAIEDMEIPLEDTDEALRYLNEDAEDGRVSMGRLMDEFAKAPDINIARQGLERMQEPMEKFGGASSTAASNMSTFSSSIGTTKEKLQQLVSGSPYTIEVIANSTGGDGGGDDGGDGDHGNIPQEMNAAGTGTGVNVTMSPGAVQIKVESLNDNLDVEEMAYRVSEVMGRRLNSQLRARGLS